MSSLLPWKKGIEEITQAEHISPEKTGDSIEAKKTAGYIFNDTSLTWQRQTDKVKLIDTNNNLAHITFLGQQMVATNYRLSGGIFNGTSLDPAAFTPVTANGGTVTVANGEVTTTVTTASGSAAGYYSKWARYIGSNINYFSTVTRIGDTGTANNIRQTGLCDTVPVTNGAFFQLNGTTMQLVLRKNGVDTVVNNGSFNGDGTQSGVSFPVDNNYHTIEIYYSHRRIQFVVDSKPIHMFTATTASLLSTWNLGAFHYSYNTNTTSTGVSQYSTVMTVSRYGEANSQPASRFVQGLTAGVQIKVGMGSITLMNITGITNNSVVTLYDGTSTAGSLIYSSGAMSNQTIPFNVEMDGDGGTTFYNGLFLTITGAAANCFIKFE